MGYLKTLANQVSNLANAVINRPSAINYNTSGYNAASNGRRVITMGSSTRSVSSLALSDGPMLNARARKAAMENPIVVNGIKSFEAEVIGTGLRPHSKHSKTDKRIALEKEFSLWVPQSSATRRIGPRGKPDSLQNFFAQQRLVCRNTREVGEAFARLRPRLASDLSPTGLRVPLQVDLIEPEQLPFWLQSGKMASPDNLIRGGIEFSPTQERVAYHFYRHHPGDAAIWPNTYEIVRVPSQSVLHVMEFLRGQQIRGVTPLASILISLMDVDDFDDATRLQQKLGSYLFAWKESLTPDDPQLNQVASVGNDTAPDGAAYVEAQPGTMTMLDSNSGEKFGFYNHPGVANTYEAYMRVQRTMHATVLQVAYDMATGDTSGGNYSRSRIRLIALRRIWTQYQKEVIEHQFCRPLWSAWLDAAALSGVIDAKDYAKNPDEYLNVEWLPQAWDWVDPEADVKTVRMQIESCLSSREEEVTKLSKNVEEVDAAIKRDHDREKELGIVPVFGASKVSETVPPGDNEELAGSEPTDPGGTENAGGSKKK